MAKTFIVAETSPITSELDRYLDHIGVEAPFDKDDYHDPIRFSDAENESEIIAELAGRLCYKSFMPGLNPNVTKTRQGNKQYIGNIIKQKHGSVLEHCSTSVIFTDVSRIFTHELVRHRPGMAFSQESQRFVRLDSFDIYIPDLTPALGDAYEYAEQSLGDDDIKTIWVNTAQQQFVRIVDDLTLAVQEKLAYLIDQWGMNQSDMPFHVKKQLTSALRRFVPGGVNTAIMVTGNHRIWRHVIQNRTSAGAEEEIAKVFGPLADKFKERYPAFYQDMLSIEPNENCAWTQYAFLHEKI